MKYLSTFLGPLLMCSGLASADVLDVGGPSAQYTNIQQAVSAAVDGDVIRVWSGNYSAFVLDGKRVIFMAKDGPGTVSVSGETSIKNIPAGSAMSISGFDFQGIQSYSHTLEIEGCLGSVRIRDCSITGGDVSSAALITDCADVAMFDTDLLSGWVWVSGWEHGISGRNCMDIVDSTLSAYSCVFEGVGGTAADHNGDSGGSGSTALWASGTCQVYLSKCTLIGGNGGSGASPSNLGNQCTYGGWGGWGFYSLHTSTEAWFLECDLRPGLGGSGLCPLGSGTTSPDGQEATLGTYLPGKTVSLRAPRDMQDNSTLTLTFSGSPGDLVGWRSGEGPGYEFNPIRGPYLLYSGPNTLQYWHFAGRIGATGMLQVDLEVTDNPAFSHRHPYFQGVYREVSTGAFYFTGSTDTIILDSAW